jgi:hypothetical protein
MAELFPSISEAQKNSRKVDHCICTGGPDYDYICKACAEKYNITKFLPFVINEVGRKACAFCGDRSQWRMDTVTNMNRKTGGCIIYY